MMNFSNVDKSSEIIFVCFLYHRTLNGSVLKLKGRGANKGFGNGESAQSSRFDLPLKMVNTIIKSFFKTKTYRPGNSFSAIGLSYQNTPFRVWLLDINFHENVLILDALVGNNMGN